ncbi:hypothetical protein BC937DRAFT_92190, partial [Endogone sp. FLAS-F59071]
EGQGRNRKTGERSLVVTVRISERPGRGSVGRHASGSSQSPEARARRRVVASDEMPKSSRSKASPFHTPTPLPSQYTIPCVRCGASFPLEEDMHRHLLSDHRVVHAATLHTNTEGKFSCPVTECMWKLGRSSDIVRHLKRAHQVEILNESEAGTKVSATSNGLVATNEDKSFSKTNDITTPQTSSLQLQNSHRPYCDTAATISRTATPIDNDDILTHTALALTTLANDSTPRLVRNVVRAGASLFTPLMTPSRVIQPSYELGPAPVFDIFGLATMRSLGGNSGENERLEGNGDGREERMMGGNGNGGGGMGGNREDEHLDRGDGRNLPDGKSNLWSSLGVPRDDQMRINQDESKTKPVPTRLHEFNANFRDEGTRQRDEDILMNLDHDDNTIAASWDMTHILQQNGMGDELNSFYPQTIEHDHFFPQNCHPNPTTWDEIQDPLYHKGAIVSPFDSQAMPQHGMLSSRERVQTPNLVGSELPPPSPHATTTSSLSLSPSLTLPTASEEGEVSLFLSFLRDLHRVE